MIELEQILALSIKCIIWYSSSKDQNQRIQKISYHVLIGPLLNIASMCFMGQTAWSMQWIEMIALPW